MTTRTEPTRIARNRASLEYLDATVTSSAPLDQPVQMAVARYQPVDADWAAAEWTGETEEVLVDGVTKYRRTARLQPFLPTGTGDWQVFVKVTDSPEIPVVNAGELYIT